jgi:hypothetical protein
MSVQRSLLPETLPEHSGVHLGARYKPAETRYGIGSDSYEAVLLLPGGRILLLVGGVAGHGLKAAITMGRMRGAARALALHPRSRGPVQRSRRRPHLIQSSCARLSSSNHFAHRPQRRHGHPLCVPRLTLHALELGWKSTSALSRPIEHKTGTPLSDDF